MHACYHKSPHLASIKIAMQMDELYAIPALNAFDKTPTLW